MILEITNQNIGTVIVFVILFFVVYFLGERQIRKNKERYRKFVRDHEKENSHKTGYYENN
jgi:preprotein translocase subunit YajC